MKYIFIFILFPVIGITQKHDNVWLMGSSSINVVQDGRQWGTMIADFDIDPVGFKFDNNITMDFLHTCAMISDTSGELKMYSNGMYVQNGNHRVIPRLDTIGYGTVWETFNYKNYFPDGSDWKSGFKSKNMVLIIPSFNPNEYALFNQIYTNDPDDNVASSRTIKLCMSNIDMALDNPEGKVLIKEETILNGHFYGGYAACRHANGRDWWLIAHEEYNASIFVFLFTPNGINLVNTYQNTSKIPKPSALMQNKFSRPGEYSVTSESYMPQYDSLKTVIYDFDRCNGEIKTKEVIRKKSFSAKGSLAFSDNDLLYLSDVNVMYQYDLDAASISSSERRVAIYNGSKFEVGPGWFTDLSFSYMELAPDGRMYCIPGGNVRSIHVMEYPNEKGEAAKMIQNKLPLETNNFNTLPSFPNFRLGPLDGSSCDTLGLDNHPIAKYRYDPDSIDSKQIRFTDLSYFRPETWSWDFGDGSPKITQKSPFHTFPKDGIYKVCLTVSNEISSNTTCRDINISGSLSSIDVLHSIDVNIFPNPVQNVLLVTIGEYVPAHASIEFYTALGQQVHRQRVYYGHNNIDLSKLPAGVYAWRIVDRGLEIKNGSVIKIE